MLRKFKEYIKTKKLCDIDQTVMLAVSGGIDSVVMTDLFYKAGYSAIILHCNFKLRGEASEKDEIFVRSLASSYDFPVFIKSFETEEYSNNQGLSIQMAARELRYEWFEEIAHEQDIEIVATAHNLNDSIETLFINMIRGTGLKGITGIPPNNDIYIRPLLFASRKEIIEYSEVNNIRYREDASNSSLKYTRNRIRHTVIPPLEEINPAFSKTMSDNIERFAQSYLIFRREIERFKERHFIHRGNHFAISISAIKQLDPLETWLFELFSDYDFSTKQCRGIVHLLESESGKQFISPSHRLYKDREQLYLYPSTDNGFKRYYIDGIDSTAALPFSLDLEVIENNEELIIGQQSNTAFIDLDKIKFPLTIRRWQYGDYFFPIGMDQMKKLSDFFIDAKIPVPQKDRTWILCSGKDIVWIMGLRLDNRYKITSKTRKILKLEL